MERKERGRGMTKDDLMKFCGGPDRKAMSTPFSIGSFTYATNGHIMVRIPRLSDISERSDAPNADGMIEKYFGYEYFPLPDVSPIKMIPCRDCEGTGRFKKCPECDGSGIVEFENDSNSYDFTCKTCNGGGKFKEGEEFDCEKCGGTGKIAERESIETSGRHYDKKYILLLKTLPDCKLAFAKNLDPAHFNFTGGDGLIMALRWPS